MSFHQYIVDRDVHVVDCSGTVDLRLGLERLELLRLHLEAHPIKGGARKLLIDFRSTIWASEETHRQLSLATRRDFGLEPSNTAIRVAILHPGGHGAASDNEHWFNDEAEALEWLTRP